MGFKIVVWWLACSIVVTVYWPWPWPWTSSLEALALALGICFWPWPWPGLGDMLVALALALALNVLALALALAFNSVALLTSLHVARMALTIHLSRHFCCRMYRLATMHSVTDRQTDRRHYDANSRSYCVQFDWLKITGRMCGRGKRMCRKKTPTTLIKLGEEFGGYIKPSNHLRAWWSIVNQNSLVRGLDNAHTSPSLKTRICVTSKGDGHRRRRVITPFVPHWLLHIVMNGHKTHLTLISSRSKLLSLAKPDGWLFTNVVFNGVKLAGRSLQKLN